MYEKNTYNIIIVNTILHIIIENELMDIYVQYYSHAANTECHTYRIPRTGE